MVISIDFFTNLEHAGKSRAGNIQYTWHEPSTSSLREYAGTSPIQDFGAISNMENLTDKRDTDFNCLK